MSKHGAYGHTLAKALGAGPSPAFLTKDGSGRPRIAVTRIKRDVADYVLTSPLASEDAVLVMLQMRSMPKQMVWADNKPAAACALPAGRVSIFDLQVSWVSYRVSPIHQLLFYLPMETFNEIADFEKVARVRRFDNDPLVGADDPTVWGLGRSLAQAFERPEEANQLFVDHITSATAVHVLRNYGVAASVPRGGLTLSPKQDARAREMIAGSLDGGISVAELAAECSLSIAEFNRAFERTAGVRPDVWLAERRMAAAMNLLRHTGIPIGDVARASGFHDRLHLRRVFLRVIGVEPEEWQEQVRH